MNAMCVFLLFLPTVQADFAEEVQKASGASRSFLEDMQTHSTMAVNPFLQRIFLSQKELLALLTSIRTTVHWEDMIFMATVGWCTVPSLQWPYQHTTLSRSLKPQTPFRQTFLYHVADHLQQIARIALLVYAVDILKMVCIGLGFDFCKMSSFPHAFAQIMYTLWIARRVGSTKKFALRQYICQHPETFGRMQIVNRLGNAGLIAAASFVVLNILKVEMGVAMHSFLALGSVGTLAIGLASQGIFSQVLNGLLLVSSDRIYEGDYVRWGNGLAGTIVKLGWMETIIRSADETMVSVPNNDLVKQQVSNLSRVRKSQVAQTLRFKYKDAQVLPLVLESIREEIVAACPTLITDGSRPFRVVWSDFGADFLQVDVDVHMHVKPMGDEYWTNRQRILQAIRTAVKKHDINFAKE